MYKHLHRSQNNRVIGGVAGGIGEYFDIDPVIVRLVFVFATFGWGFSILLYIVMWIAIPADKKIEAVYDIEQKTEEEKFQQTVIISEERKESRKKLASILLIVLGVLLFIHNIQPWFAFHELWPLVLIAFGIYLLLKKQNINISKEEK